MKPEKRDAARILVVDDEQDLREILQFNLESEGYAVQTASSGEEALDKLDDSYALILLDVMMDGMSGYKMTEVLRKERHCNIPIIFLTARTMENDLLTGFSVGGDDYITKPFSIKELLVRLKAVLKRAPQTSTNGPQIKVGDLLIDMDSKEVRVGDQKTILTKKEFEILALLAQSKGRYLSREMILNIIWGDIFVAERTVDVHITNLRKKLAESSVCIHSRTNYGYVLEEE